MFCWVAIGGVFGFACGLVYELWCLWVVLVGFGWLWVCLIIWLVVCVCDGCWFCLLLIVLWVLCLFVCWCCVGVCGCDALWFCLVNIVGLDDLCLCRLFGVVYCG